MVLTSKVTPKIPRNNSASDSQVKKLDSPLEPPGRNEVLLTPFESYKTSAGLRLIFFW